MDSSLILGCYGAALSSIIAFREWWKGRRSVRITSAPAYNSADFDPPGLFVRVTIANHRIAPVFVRVVFLQIQLHPRTVAGALRFLATHSRWQRRPVATIPLLEGATIKPPLPTAIEPGRAIVVWLPREALQRLLEDHGYPAAFVGLQDELDRTFVGPRLRM